MVAVGETYKVLKRVSFRDAQHRYESGEKIMPVYCKANLEYSGVKPWRMYDKDGNIYEWVDKEQVFKIIDRMEHKRTFSLLVEDYENEHCDEYNGKHAAFMVEVMS